MRHCKPWLRNGAETVSNADCKCCGGAVAETMTGRSNASERSPDLARVTIEYPYGDILSRPAWTSGLRQLCTVAMLTANGSAQPQLQSI